MYTDTYSAANSKRSKPGTSTCAVYQLARKRVPSAVRLRYFFFLVSHVPLLRATTGTALQRPFSYTADQLGTAAPWTQAKEKLENSCEYARPANRTSQSSQVRFRSLFDYLFVSRAQLRARRGKRNTTVQEHKVIANDFKSDHLSSADLRAYVTTDVRRPSVRTPSSLGRRDGFRTPSAMLLIRNDTACVHSCPTIFFYFHLITELVVFLYTSRPVSR